MLRPMKGLLTTSRWQMTVEGWVQAGGSGNGKVNLVIIWIFGLQGKGKCQGRLTSGDFCFGYEQLHQVGSYMYRFEPIFMQETLN